MYTFNLVLERRNQLPLGFGASVLSRYCKFFSSIKTSPSLEVRVVANIAAADIRSSVGKNIFNLGKEAGMILTMENLWEVRRVLLDLKTQVPSQDSWRLECLRKFMYEKYLLLAKDENTEEIDSLIDSICVS